MRLGRNLVIVLLVFGALLAVVYPLSMIGKFGATGEAGEIALSGEFLSARYEPDEPKILEKVTITTVIKNNGNEQNRYLMEIRIIEGGETKYSNDFTFLLLPDSTISFSPSYAPDEVGEYSAVLRLYDRNKIVLYDEEILTFVVQSEVGPFDLEVDMPSHIIGLGDSLPVTTKITNMGVDDVDIGLNLNLHCTSGKNVSKSLYVFVNGSSEIKRQFLLGTCGDTGQHSLTTSLVLYGRELISSKNQFYVNASLPKVAMSVQDSIKANAGGTTNFGVEVKNMDNSDLVNIRLFIHGIPPDWLLVKPSSLNTLEPNEITIFMATVNVPKDAETKDYDIIVGIGGDNVFFKKDATLSITGLAVAPSVLGSLYELISSYPVQIVMAIAIILSVCLLLIRGRRGGYDREVILRKIRDATR